jgi:carbamate kinase
LGAVLHEGGTTSKGRQKERNHNIWVNYNDLTTTSLEIMVSKGNHPQMALIQVSEIL